MTDSPEYYEIGILPPVGNRDRRERSRQSLQAFCETYMPEYVGRLDDRRGKEAMSLESLMLRPEQFSNHIMTSETIPQFSGIKPLFVAAALWAILHGHRSYLCFVAANQYAAEIMLSQACLHLQLNQTLREDFPESCLPVQAAMRERLNYRGQPQVKYRGKPLPIAVGDSYCHLPRIESVPSFAILMARSIDRLTNMSFPNGIVGPVGDPDFLFADDPEDEPQPAVRASMQAMMRRSPGSADESLIVIKETT